MREVGATALLLRPAGRLGLTALALAMATGLRVLLDPILGAQYPLLTYYPFITALAFFLGWRLAAFATVGAVLIGAALFIGPEQFRTPQAIALGLFFVPMQAALIGFIEVVRRARERAEQFGREAHRSAAERDLALSAAGISTWTWDLVSQRVSFDRVRGIDPRIRGIAEPLPVDEFLDRVEPADRDAIWAALERAKLTGSYDVEHRFNFGGKTYWLLAKGQLERDEWGVPSRIRGVGIDLTRQRSAESELRASEERYRLATAALNGYIYDWDPRTDRVQCSAGFTRLLGYAASAEGYSGAWWRERLHPDDRAVAALPPRQQRAEQGSYVVEYRVRHADGHYIWVADHSVAIVEQGHSARVIGNVYDVTARKQADASALEHRERLDAALATADVGTWWVDFRTRNSHRDANFNRLIGLPPAPTVVPLSEATDVIHVEDRAQALGEWRRAIEMHEPYSSSFRIVRPDGELRWVRARGEFRFDPEGRLLYGVGATIDLTPEIRHQEMLQAADRQKDEFLAMLAHELRNPLAPIRNASELLTRAVGNVPAAQLPLAMLSRQTRQLMRLVDDLLDVSRIGRGRIVLQHEPLDIATVVDQAVEMAQSAIREKGHRLRVTRVERPIWVRGDRARLVQCVGNVLQNAVKYTDAGGEITVQIRAADDDASVEIEVRDTGSGIARELLPHIFDLFVQSERTLDRSQGGLGIGLSVVKRLVEMHGGRVSASSEGIGRGASFLIRLPRIASPDAASRSKALVRSDAVAEPHSRRVLVVDDNADAADSLAMLLRLEGHEVEAVYGAASALEAAERFEPDLVLLDIGLPQMDGYEVARRLRARFVRHAPRLVALTGYGQREDRERAQQAGFDEHLVKPADPAELARILEAPDRTM